MVEVELGQYEEEVVLLVQEGVVEEVQDLLDDFDDVVQRVLVDEVFDEVHGLEVEDVVHRVDVLLELVHRVEVVFDLVQLEVFEEVVEHLVEVLVVQGFDVVLVVQALVEVVVQGLLEEVVHGVEHEVLVQVVAGVQVQVLQLLVTTGLPAVVISKVLQRLDVVVVGWHSLPLVQTTVGQTGPVS